MNRYLAASAAVIAITIAAPACAQERTYTFDIPAQNLAEAVRAFAKTTRQQVSFNGDDVRGRTSRPVKGQLGADDALRQLLQGTGVTYRRAERNVIVLMPSTEGNVPSAEEAVNDRNEAGPASSPSAYGPIVVTGTRIPGKSPIAETIVAKRADIEQSGRTSLVDFITTIPQVYLSNSGASAVSGLGGIVDQSFSSAISLRGLGAESTLTLLNGRRMAPSGGGAFGAITDISGIPVAAIERVEIIPDGGSAVYGSDALGGVVNIILRKSLNGAELSGSFGFGRDGKPKNWRGTIAGGHSWNGGSILAVYEHLEFGNLATQDRDFTSTRDLRPRGGTDFRLAFGAPGNVTAVDGNLNLVQQAFGLSAPVRTAALPQGSGLNLTPGAVTPNVQNFTDAFDDASIFPGDKRNSIWVSFEQELSPSVSAYANVIYSRRKIQANLGAPIQNVLVPATNAFNPFGETVRVSYVYQKELGSQILDRTLTGFAGTAGLEGKFGGSWSWDVGLSHAKSRYRADASLEIDTVAQASLLASSDRSVALNVFGDGSGQNLTSLKSVLFPHIEFGEGVVQSATGVVRGDLNPVDVGAGPLKVAFGLEHRRESQELHSLSTRPGAAPGTVFGGPSRHVSAAFAEARLALFNETNARPGLHDLELSLAAREEHYSDFGNAFNPRAALLWRPVETLALRGSISRSFRAPSLELLFGPSSTSCCTPVADPKHGNQTVGVTIVQSRNPDLGPERSTAKSVGLQWSPFGRSADVEVELNYFHVRATDRVTLLTGSLSLIQAEDVIPPGLVIRDSAGNLTTLVFKPFNSAIDESDGFDGHIGVGGETPIGYLHAGLSGAYQLRLERQLLRNGPVVDNSENLGFSPKWKVRGELSLRRGGFTGSAFINSVPGATNLVFRLPDGTLQKTKGWTTVDLNFAYDFGNRSYPWAKGLRLSAAVLNLFDLDPPFVNGFLPYDPTRADPRGRFINFSLTKPF